MVKNTTILLACAVLLSGTAAAKSLYVNNSGSPACSDSTNYATNDASNPWCTIGRAAWGSDDPNSPSASQAAQAGDIVYIASGTYNTSSTRTSCTSARWSVALNPANSGTSGASIKFIGVGTVNVLLASGYAGPTIGADERDYIIWDNIRIDETIAQGVSCADTGPVVFHISTGSSITNSSIRGEYNTWSDNYCGIRLEATNQIVVSNNEIYGFTGNWGHNDAGIITYDNDNSTIEHNYIHDNGTGIYVKGEHTGDGYPQDNHTIRLNWFDNNPLKSILVYSGNNTLIYQNVIKQPAGYAIRFDSLNNSGSAVVNNTIIRTGTAEVYGYSGSVVSPTVTNFRIYNNIFYGTFDEDVNLGDAASIGGQTFEHNVYYGFRNFGSLNGSLISLATWKSSYRQDNAIPASINADPLFVDTVLYKLQPGSPARTLGIDILDLDRDGSTTDVIPAGAYLTGYETIGISSGALSAPSNFRIITQ